jgi:hypothetical protein
MLPELQHREFMIAYVFYDHDRVSKLHSWLLQCAYVQRDVCSLFFSLFLSHRFIVVLYVGV